MSTHNLDTGKKYVKDIFAEDCFYNIPEYQRPYVWEEDNVIALVEDLAAALAHDKKKEYFLGCMIWNTIKKEENEIPYECWDILDGQQRFITLYLLQAVIRDLCEDPKLKDVVQERMKQEANIYNNIPERNRIVFEIRDDQNFLEKYLLPMNSTLDLESISSVYKDRDLGTSVRNMAASIIAMHRWFTERLKKDTNQERQKYLSEYFRYLSNNVLALYLATPDNLDDAYNLFTVLNSRGMQLQVSDILRAQNLRAIENEATRKNCASKWEDFESAIDAPYRAFDDFLWALVFIKMKYRSDDNKSLKGAFDFMYKRDDIQKGVRTFDFIGTYIDHFKVVTTKGLGSTEGQKTMFQSLNHILTETFGSMYVAPLMHFRDCFGEAHILEFFIKLDNLCSAYWLLAGRRNLQSRIFIILRKMDEIKRSLLNQDEATQQFLASEVLRYEYDDPNASTKIEIEELFEMFDTEDWGGFAGTRINKTRYLLLKLDMLSGSPYHPIRFDRKSSSVEHLMPQKIKKPAWDISPEEHQEWVHRLGNIVLLDIKKNSSIKNSSYSNKKKKYKSAIESRNNTNFVFIHYPEWGIETIRHNHERALNMLKAYYLHNSLLDMKEWIKRKEIWEKDPPKTSNSTSQLAIGF